MRLSLPFVTTKSNADGKTQLSGRSFQKVKTKNAMSYLLGFDFPKPKGAISFRSTSTVSKDVSQPQRKSLMKLFGK